MLRFDESTKRLVAFARGRGWRVSRAKSGHIRFDKEGCQTVFFSSTPSDYRAALNAKSKLRRADAGQGVVK